MGILAKHFPYATFLVKKYQLVKRKKGNKVIYTWQWHCRWKQTNSSNYLSTMWAENYIAG